MERGAGNQRQFGDLKLDLTAKMLWHKGEPVPMPLKELELLCLLVERSGELVTKDELMDRVWEDSFVEESNLSRHIYLLRKKLSELGADPGLIENVPRRGYRFTADLDEALDDLLTIDTRTSTRTFIEIEESDGGPPDIEPPAAQRQKISGISSPTIVLEDRGPIRKMASFPRLGLIGIFAGIVAIAGYFLLGNHLSFSEKSSGSIGSVAVLPFKEIGSSPDVEFAGAGMANALTLRLSNIKQLAVRQTDTAYNSQAAAEEGLAIGKRLRVDAVVEGTIQRDGNRVRVGIRLIRVSDGAAILAETFDDAFTNLFSVQDSISEKVASALALELTGTELKALKRYYTTSVEADQLYHKGRFFWNKRTRDGFLKAIELFEEALRIDPSFPLPHTGIADSYYLLGDYSYLPPEESIVKAKVSALRALSLDDRLSEAHTSLAYAQFLYDWDWDGAETSFKRAIELNPNYATAHQWYGELLLAMGRTDEALERMEAARDCAPLSPALIAVNCWMLYVARQPDRSLDECVNALEMDRDLYVAHFWIGQIKETKGDIEGAIKDYEKAIELSPSNSEVMASLGHALAKTGRTERARNILAELTTPQPDIYVSSYLKALIHIGLGETGIALKMLEQGMEERARAMPFLRVDPMMDSLRAEKQFNTILKQMKL